MIKEFLQHIGLYPTEQDLEIRNMVQNSYKSLRVVGRGTVKIDPGEVRQSDEFKEALKQARVIVGNS